MKNHYFLKPALTGLAKFQIALEKKGGASEDGNLFEEIIAIQAGILKSFGLPANPDNEKLLWFSSLPTDLEVWNIIAQLHKTATDYLLSNAKPELHILKDAQEHNLDPFYVLPELKITTHSYPLFVYSKILLERKDTVENILHELKFVNRPELLSVIGNLEQENVENAAEMVQLLKENGVKYLDDFLSSTTAKNDNSKSVQLLKFLNNINGKGEFSSLSEKFNSLTYCLMNYLCLSVGKNAYRITECEIYYYDIEDHSDPYVHQGIPQLSAGRLYLNKAGGLDITFGNENLPVFAGILIRGIRNLKTNQYTNKITGIVTEVFDSLGNIITGENGIHLRELMPGQLKIEEPVRTKRVGLTKKENDEYNFIERPYRYIVELNPSHKFKDKEKVVKQLLSESKISNDEAKNILGYNVNS